MDYIIARLGLLSVDDLRHLKGAIREELNQREVSRVFRSKGYYISERSDLVMPNNTVRTVEIDFWTDVSTRDFVNMRIIEIEGESNDDVQDMWFRYLTHNVSLGSLHFDPIDDGDWNASLNLGDPMITQAHAIVTLYYCTRDIPDDGRPFLVVRHDMHDVRHCHINGTHVCDDDDDDSHICHVTDLNNGTFNVMFRQA